MARQQQMVVPKTVAAEVTVQAPPRPERGGGVKVQVEVSAETHERLKLELLLRKRRGAPATIEDVLHEMVEREKRSWPALPAEAEA